MKIHIVRPGDTLWKLSRHYNIPLQTLIDANPQIKDPNKLVVGTKIRIPTGGVPIKRPDMPKKRPDMPKKPAKPGNPRFDSPAEWESPRDWRESPIWDNAESASSSPPLRHPPRFGDYRGKHDKAKGVPHPHHPHKPRHWHHPPYDWRCPPMDDGMMDMYRPYMPHPMEGYPYMGWHGMGPYHGGMMPHYWEMPPCFGGMPPYHHHMYSHSPVSPNYYGNWHEDWDDESGGPY